MFGKAKTRLLIILILWLAFAFRIVGIAHIPPGLSHDEAYNGVTAIQVLEGQYRIFFEINKGIEPLIIYLEALAFYLFGIGPVQLRLVNIICGLLTVALIYPLTARLFNRQVALLAMLGLAISFWAIFVSRLTLRAVTLPPLLMLTLYLFWCGLTIPFSTSANFQTTLYRLYKLSLNSILSRLKRGGNRIEGCDFPHESLQPRTLRYAVATHDANSHKLLISKPSTLLRAGLQSPIAYFTLSGLAAGATMYTYLSSRFVPFILATVFGYQLLRHQIRRVHWLGLIILFIIWAMLLSPLANYYFENLDSFTERSDQVTTIPYILNGEFGPMFENIVRTLGMFTFAGDETDRYNLDGRPVFDWFNGLFFYFGLILILLRLGRKPSLAGPAIVLLSWLFFMLLPDFITDDSPHFLRTIGALPAVYISWAVGLEKVQQWLTARLQTPPGSPWRYASMALVVLTIGLAMFLTTNDYFYRWQWAPEARYIYGADIAQISRQLQAPQAGDFAAISAEYYRDLDPFRLAVHLQGTPPFAIWFDGRQSLAFPPRKVA